MITTTYTCDCCKQKVENVNELWSLELKITGQYGAVNTAIPNTQMCRNCLVERGIVTWMPSKPVAPPTTPPTLDDVLREFVLATISNQ